MYTFNDKSFEWLEYTKMKFQRVHVDRFNLKTINDTPIRKGYQFIT